ncbi:MAG: DUF1566 domain-containing protein [Bacteroidales bacterium]
MKKLFTILSIIILTASVFAQSPEKMSYQAVIRNSSNALVTNTQIGMVINIRQGSVSGTVVYTETQTPTTNANGLVSIEIGGGTGFNMIDWSAATYFIETKTDPTGGTNYTITGTSQLLSVPYALHAKTAETVTGTIIETDPTFTSSQAANITAGDITKLSNLSGVNTGDQDLSGLATTSAVTTGLATKVDKVTGKGLSTNDYTTAEQSKLAGIATGAEVNVNADWNAVTGDAQILNKPTIPTAADGSETKVTAGTNVTVTGTGTTASPYVLNATGATTLTIGQSYQGGIIFWLDATGQHGLIAATTDQSTGIQWYNGTYTTTNAVRDGIGAGMYNTERIIANQSTGSYAAQLCANYQGGGYGDWYLPSKYELNLLYLQKTAVGGFAGDYYWSSTEGYSINAWNQTFGSGLQNLNPKTNAFYVRAVRAF